MPQQTITKVWDVYVSPGFCLYTSKWKCYTIFFPQYTGKKAFLFIRVTGIQWLIST